MKRTNIHISAAIALLLGLAACTQDEAGFLPEGAEGTSIVLTATGLNPAATAIAGTRAPADGNWTGVQSVAVMMDGMVKTYNVTPSTADPTSATLTSTDPYYWTNHNDITVTAWWPYTAGETTPPAVKVKANQSAQKDFEGSDLIVADGQTVTYGSPTLRFTHRTARVTIVLTDYTEGLASVQLTGLSTEGDNPDIIVPYDKGSNTYTAIVAPQSVAAGTTFITCTFTNGKAFVYKMKNATDWQAGGEYTYTVSLAAAKDLGYTIESNGSYTVTSADGLMNIAELVNGGKSDINITLDTDIDLTGKDWTPIGTDYDNSYKGTFDAVSYTHLNAFEQDIQSEEELLTNSGIEPEMVSEEVPESYTEFIEKVDNWIKTDGYVQQGLTIKELSKILYTNRTYLSAYIKTTYKMTFREWITDLRLEYTKNILKEHPEINIQKLAESSGFLSRSNFIKAFTEKEGCTPGKWKKANQE